MTNVPCNIADGSFIDLMMIYFHVKNSFLWWWFLFRLTRFDVPLSVFLRSRFLFDSIHFLSDVNRIFYDISVVWRYRLRYICFFYSLLRSLFALKQSVLLCSDLICFVFLFEGTRHPIWSFNFLLIHTDLYRFCQIGRDLQSVRSDQIFWFLRIQHVSFANSTIRRNPDRLLLPCWIWFRFLLCCANSLICFAFILIYSECF